MKEQDSSDYLQGSAAKGLLWEAIRGSSAETQGREVQGGVTDDICDQGKISQDESRGKVITLMIKKPYQRASEVGDWSRNGWKWRLIF